MVKFQQFYKNACKAGYLNRYFKFYKTYKQMSLAKVSSILREFLRENGKRSICIYNLCIYKGEMSYLCNYYTVESFVSIEIMTQLI